MKQSQKTVGEDEAKSVNVERLIKSFERDPRYKTVRDEALKIMEGVALPYHGGVDHPLELERYALMIAVGENIPKEQLPLLSLAAVLHETGIGTGYEDHEARGRHIAYGLMTKAGYSPSDMVLVGDLIYYGTKCFPQTPRNTMEQIMADADLGNLGTDNFSERGELLRRELRVNDTYEWALKQRDFVGQHRYFTATARKMFDKKQRENLKMLKRHIEDYEKGLAPVVGGGWSC
jgi:uncharacterized protein